MSAYDVMDGLLRTSLVEIHDPLSDLDVETQLIAEGDDALLGLWYMVTGRSLVFCEDDQFEQWLGEADDEETPGVGKYGRVKTGPRAHSPVAKQVMPARERPHRTEPWAPPTRGFSPEDRAKWKLKDSESVGKEPETKFTGATQDPPEELHPGLLKHGKLMPVKPTKKAEKEAKKAGVTLPPRIVRRHPGQAVSRSGDVRTNIGEPHLGKTTRTGVSLKGLRGLAGRTPHVPSASAAARLKSAPALSPSHSAQDVHQAMHHIATINPDSAEKLSPDQHKAIATVMDAHGAHVYSSHTDPAFRGQEAARKEKHIQREVDKVKSPEAQDRAKARASKSFNPGFIASGTKEKTAGDHDATTRGIEYLTGTSSLAGSKTYNKPWKGLHDIATAYTSRKGNEDPKVAPDDAHDQVRASIKKAMSRAKGKLRAHEGKRAKRGRGKQDPGLAKKGSELSGGGDDGDDVTFDPGAGEEDTPGEHGLTGHAHPGSSTGPEDRFTQTNRAHDWHGKDHPEHIAKLFKHLYDKEDSAERIKHHMGQHEVLARGVADSRTHLENAKAAHVAAHRDHHDAVLAGAGHETLREKHHAFVKARDAHEQAATDHDSLQRNARTNAHMLSLESDRYNKAIEDHAAAHHAALKKEGTPHLSPNIDDQYRNYGFKMDHSVASLGHVPTDLSYEDKPKERSARRSPKKKGAEVKTDDVDLSLFDMIFEAEERDPGSDFDADEDEEGSAAAPKAGGRKKSPAEIRRAAFAKTGVSKNIGSGNLDAEKVVTPLAKKWFPHMSDSERSRHVKSLLTGPDMAADVQTLAGGMAGMRPLSTRSSLGRAKEITGLELRHKPAGGQSRSLGLRPASAIEAAKRRPPIPPSHIAAFVQTAETGRRAGGKGGKLGPEKVAGEIEAKKQRNLVNKRAAIKAAGDQLQYVHGKSPAITPARAATIRAASAEGEKKEKEQKKLASTFQRFSKSAAREHAQKLRGGAVDAQTDLTNSLSLFGSVFMESRRGASLFEAVIA